MERVEIFKRVKRCLPWEEVVREERIRRPMENLWGDEDKEEIRRSRRERRLCLLTDNISKSDLWMGQYRIERRLVVAFLITSERQKQDELEKRKQTAERKQATFPIYDDLLYDLGSGSSGYPALFDEKFKEAIKRRDDYRCQNPGCRSDAGRSDLVVHHIDYDKRNCDPRNLITLCRMCNLFANTYREEWRALYRKIILHRKVPRFVRTSWPSC